MLKQQLFRVTDFKSVGGGALLAMTAQVVKHEPVDVIVRREREYFVLLAQCLM
jgi:hypothetical protein